MQRIVIYPLVALGGIAFCLVVGLLFFHIMPPLP